MAVLCSCTLLDLGLVTIVVQGKEVVTVFGIEEVVGDKNQCGIALDDGLHFVGKWRIMTLHGTISFNVLLDQNLYQGDGHCRISPHII